MPRYQATYRDPVDNSITHYWEFNAENEHHAKARAKDSILQRNDGYVDVLDVIKEIEQ